MTLERHPEGRTRLTCSTPVPKSDAPAHARTPRSTPRRAPRPWAESGGPARPRAADLAPSRRRRVTRRHVSSGRAPGQPLQPPVKQQGKWGAGCGDPASGIPRPNPRRQLFGSLELARTEAPWAFGEGWRNAPLHPGGGCTGHLYPRLRRGRCPLSGAIAGSCPCALDFFEQRSPEQWERPYPCPVPKGFSSLNASDVPVTPLPFPFFREARALSSRVREVG